MAFSRVFRVFLRTKETFRHKKIRLFFLKAKLPSVCLFFSSKKNPFSHDWSYGTPAPYYFFPYPDMPSWPPRNCPLTRTSQLFLQRGVIFPCPDHAARQLATCKCQFAPLKIPEPVELFTIHLPPKCPPFVPPNTTKSDHYRG